jgi:hypothetical protein
MRHVLAAVLCKSNNCRPEAAESHAQESDSQRRIYVIVMEPTGLICADGDGKGGLALRCDENDYRAVRNCGR